jgi:hypothetical protein
MGEISVHPLCEGVGRTFSLAHALEAKEGELQVHLTSCFKLLVFAQGEQLGVVLGWARLGKM